MNIRPENAYRRISPYFGFWVKIFEMPPRYAELAHLPADSVLLICAPPTDPCLPLLVSANHSGTTCYFALSDSLADHCHDFLANTVKTLLPIHILTLPRLQQETGKFDTIIANCFFDFCAGDEIDQFLNIFANLLQPGGRLISVHMAPAGDFPARLWSNIFRVLPALFGGCHPVTLERYLGELFEVIKIKRFRRFGFPLEYFIARKQ